jgi:hypothetical protein
MRTYFQRFWHQSDGCAWLILAVVDVNAVEMVDDLLR